MISLEKYRYSEADFSCELIISHDGDLGPTVNKDVRTLIIAVTCCHPAVMSTSSFTQWAIEWHLYTIYTLVSTVVSNPVWNVVDLSKAKNLYPITKSSRLIGSMSYCSVLYAVALQIWTSSSATICMNVEVYLSTKSTTLLYILSCKNNKFK